MKYIVSASQKTSWWATIEVDAANKQEAESIAKRSNDDLWIWDQTEGPLRIEEIERA